MHCCSVADLAMWLEASRYFLFSRLLAILLAHI
jgi:hypothetical protein